MLFGDDDGVPGVKAHIIPLAGLYPGMLWPRPIYTPGCIMV